MTEFLRFWNELGWLSNLLSVAPVVVGAAFLVRKSISGWTSAYNRWMRYSLIRKMNDSAYLQRVQAVVSNIYAGTEFVSVYGKAYPAILFRPARKFTYPFRDLCRLDSTAMHSAPLNRMQRKYMRLLGDSVKRPKMKGFATKEIELDAAGRVERIHARVTSYEQNLVTAHILEWEMFRRYQKNRVIDADVLSHLPFRAAYHGEHTPAEAVLKPSNAFPLISLQALVIYKDYKAPEESAWKAIVAQRQKNVAIKPDLWQIQPAGGFEVYGDENDDLDIQLRQGFDVRTALFREFAEELYDIEELSYCSDSRDPDSILSEKHIAYLIKLIGNGNATIDFLGIVTDLTILRQELSFLIVIDDRGFCEEPILGSSEARKMFSMNMEDVRKTFSTQNVHSSSAGLLQLAIESERLQGLGISAMLSGDRRNVLAGDTAQTSA